MYMALIITPSEARSRFVGQALSLSRAYPDHTECWDHLHFFGHYYSQIKRGNKTFSPYYLLDKWPEGVVGKHYFAGFAAILSLARFKSTIPVGLLTSTTLKGIGSWLDHGILNSELSPSDDPGETEAEWREFLGEPALQPIGDFPA